MGRRAVLGTAAAIAGAVTLAPLDALTTRSAAAATGSRQLRKSHSPDYGPLFPTRDETTGLPLLLLPRGFQYLSFGWTGDMMSDGVPTPPVHDGMGAFRIPAARGSGDRVHLVRNHEVPRFGGSFTQPAYDPDGSGGTTTLTFDPLEGRFLESYASLSGTVRNCAGGPTPWGTWLTCEESWEFNPNTDQWHGYVFEVPHSGKGDPTPLKAMGRFVHEAVAVDPVTGYVYETEDATTAGFFRFRPRVPGRLGEGGVLEMLTIGDASRDTSRDAAGTTYHETSWVPIDEPDPGPDVPSPTQQGIAKGGATFSRLEGAWYGNDRIYIVSTSGGPAQLGQVFELCPRTGTLRVLFASPGEDVLTNPDNIAVSPRGGIVLCEDGTGVQCLHGLTTDGQIFPFAANNVVFTERLPGRPTVEPGDYTSSEWAGSTFEPGRGRWLFANLQSPGITVAITGPWRNGSL